MLVRYKSIYAPGEVEIVEKKSRFIASVRPVAKEEEAIAFLESIRKKYPDARHHCYAYSVGEGVETQRFSDDGEPGGTAGMPILDMIRNNKLRNTCIVVTRYFGGTLLGTGGLVRAYSQAAKEGIEEGLVIEKVLYERYHLKVDYKMIGKVQYEVLNLGYVIEDTLYFDEVLFKVLVPKEECDTFINKVEEMTNGSKSPEFIDYAYGADVNGEFKIIK